MRNLASKKHGKFKIILPCERCLKEHGGEYGSGRFCSKNCARSFSSLVRRDEVNVLVSRTAKLNVTNAYRWKKGERLSPEIVARAVATRKEKMAEIRLRVSAGMLQRVANLPWEKLGPSSRRARVFAEQDHKCLHCGIKNWLGKQLTFELDHIDGNPKNNIRENLRMLCPNCHAQTPTWKRKLKYREQPVKQAAFQAVVMGSTPIRYTNA